MRPARLAHVVAFAILAACQAPSDQRVAAPDTPESPRPAAGADPRIPRPAPATYASWQYALAVRLPPGLAVCPVPPGFVGADHGESFYLVPPPACDTTAGFVLAPVADPPPLVEIYYGYNTAEVGEGDDVREARTAAEAMSVLCGDAPVEPIEGVTLLGRPAVGCTTRRDGRVIVKAGALYALDAPPGTANAEVVASLVTTPARLERDRATFAAFAAAIHECVALWDSGDGRRTRYNDAPGRPECPASGEE